MPTTTLSNEEILEAMDGLPVTVRVEGPGGQGAAATTASASAAPAER